MHPIVFRIPEAIPILGGAPITSFGVFMFLAFVTSGYSLRNEMKLEGYEPDKAWDVVFMAVIGGIVGAKLYYVFLNYPRLQAEGLSFLFSRGGMVWYGGFLLATVLCLWEYRRSGIPILKGVDMAAPGLAIGYAVGRIGCFLVGDDWGRPTSLPWGMRFPEGAPATTVTNIEGMFGIQVDPALVAEYGQVIPVHPTQLYEVALSALIFLVLIRLRPNRHAMGWLFSGWLMLAGGERFFVEFFRAKDDRFFGVFTLAQLLSMALVAVGLYGVTKLRRPAAAGGPEPRGRASKKGG